MTVSTKTLASSVTDEYPITCAQSRNLDLIITHGVSRGKLWDGLASAAVDLGVDPPEGTHTLADSGGSSPALTYYAGWRWVDTSGNQIGYSNLSTLASTTADTGATFTHTNIPAAPQTRIDGVEFFRSTGGQQITVYKLYAVGIAATLHGATVSANNNGFVKYTTTAAHGLRVGDIVIVASHGVAQYNVEQTVTLVDSTTTFTTNVGFVTTGTGGTATQRVYTLGSSGTITSSASTGGGSPKVVFTVPAGHKLGVGARFLVASHSVAGYNTTHEVTAVTATTVTTDVNYSADGTGGTWALNGLDGDDATDAELITQPALPILNPDGSLNARRFVPPPKHMAVVQFFQDRAVYGVVMEYAVGTVTTNGTTTLTGSGTEWNADMVGRYIALEDETQLHKITAYSSATSLTIERAASSSAGSQTYAIIPHPSEFAKILFSEQDEPESVPATNNIIIQDNTADPDKNTALAPYGAALYVYQTKHLYKVTFARQPQIQANVTLVASRGCVNQRCYQQYEGSLYALDRAGVWQYDIGSGWAPLSPPLQDIFRDGDLDWSKSRWWWSVVNPEEETIRWFVNYSDANYTKPNRALVYHLRHKAWWTESYVHELSGGCNVLISGRMRTLYGGQNEQIYLSAQGTADGVTTATAHTATGGTTTTATGSGLGSSINCSIAFTSGSNKGLARRITANTGSAITFTPALSTAVASGDTFVIGGIPWNLKSGLLPFPDNTDVEKAEGAVMRALRVAYNPTTNACTVNVRVWRDHDTAAASNIVYTNPGTGLTTAAASADFALDFKRTKSGLGNAPGYHLVPIEEGRLDWQTPHNRHIAWELRGVAGLDLVEIYELEAYGVG